MRINKQDFYHGAALTQLAEHKAFTAINKADDKYGHYAVNHDKRIFIRYRSNPSSPWQFEFAPHEVLSIKDDLKAGFAVFLCLVCGMETVIALNSRQLYSVIDPNFASVQWLKVEMQETGSMYVIGSRGIISGMIHHTSFPDSIFEDAVQSTGNQHQLSLFRRK